jgi:hypothetical protein
MMTGYWSQPRRDVAGYLAWVTAWVLVPIWYNFRLRDPEERWSLAEVQRYARARPTTGHEMAGSNIVRMVAWFSVGIAGLAVFLIANWTALALMPESGGVPMPVELSLFAVMMFAAAAGIVSSLRWGACAFLEGPLDRRLDEAYATVSPAQGFVVRICAPSNVDLLVAAVVSWGMTLAHHESLLA